jgi:hypothetical protein
MRLQVIFLWLSRRLLFFSHLTHVFVDMLMITRLFGAFVLLLATSFVSASGNWAQNFAEAKIDDFLQANKENLTRISKEARVIYRLLKDNDSVDLNAVDRLYTKHLEELSTAAKNTSASSIDSTNKFISQLFQTWMSEKCQKFDAIPFSDKQEDDVNLDVSKFTSIIQLKNAIVDHLNSICLKRKVNSGSEYESFISCNPVELNWEFFPSILVFGVFFVFSISTMLVLSFRKHFGGVKNTKNSLRGVKLTKK